MERGEKPMYKHKKTGCYYAPIPGTDKITNGLGFWKATKTRLLKCLQVEDNEQERAAINERLKIYYPHHEQI